jgi:hypothetical protein
MKSLSARLEAELKRTLKLWQEPARCALECEKIIEQLEQQRMDSSKLHRKRGNKPGIANNRRSAFQKRQ